MEPIAFQGRVERLAPEVPRFIVFSGNPWGRSEPFLVEAAVNGVSMGLRTLVPWKERGWSFGLSETLCKKAGVDTGDTVDVVMTLPEDPRPPELREVLRSNKEARARWDRLKNGQRVQFVLWVSAGAKPGTRVRRAATLVRS